MNITLRTVDPSRMRYPTTGDWETLPDGSLVVTVADYGGREDNAFLVALHELVEVYLCKKRGISDRDAIMWDVMHPELDEPGDHPDAPYAKEHAVATFIERQLAKELRIDWDEHDTWVQNAGNEVDRALKLPVPSILRNGPRAWTELHLFALRHDGSDDSEWLARWVKSLNFEGCPCEQHLRDLLASTPPTWGALFDWSVVIHNSVNERLGKPILDVEDARSVWLARAF